MSCTSLSPPGLFVFIHTLSCTDDFPASILTAPDDHKNGNILHLAAPKCKCTIIRGMTCNWFYTIMISSNPLRKLQKLWLEFSGFRKGISSMNEVMQVRAASWPAMIKQRNDSGLTVKEWCAANAIQESVYYYRLNRLRKWHLMFEKHRIPSKTILLFPEPLLRYQLLLLFRLRISDSPPTWWHSCGSKQRCSGSHPFLSERGDVPCFLRSPAFGPSISTAENVIFAKELMDWRRY